MDSPTMSLRAPADVLSAISFLLGFAPADSIVVLGLRAKKIVFQARIDLPVADDPDELAMQTTELAKQAASVVARQRVTRAIVVGYGPEPRVTPVVSAVRTELRRHRIDIPDALRVTEGRYWSYVCDNSRCCPPDGVPFDVTASSVVVPATIAGLSVLPSREALEATLAPVTGAAALDRFDAAVCADVRLAEMLSGRAGGDAVTALHDAGRSAVDMAVLRITYDGVLTDDEVAWLGLLLLNITVRDYAWERVDDDLPLNVALWTDVMRRVETDLVAPPATLLAYSAWRNGDGAICSIALGRALDADPDYRMARYLAAAIEGGLSPEEYLRRADQDAGADVQVTSAKPPGRPWRARRPRRPRRRRV
jgi:Domain of unknown function (DUF4192)